MVDPTTLRHDDQMLVHARVRQSRTDRGMLAEFKNGDTLPIGSVEVESVVRHALSVGDRCSILDYEGKIEEADVTIKSIHLDLDPPQVSYVALGTWPLRTARLDQVRRLA